jgi:YD repeat-containing protein
MTRGFITAVVALVTFNCIWNDTAQGQQGISSCQAYAQLWQAYAGSNCLWQFGWDDLPLANPPANLVCCNFGGIPFNESCIAPRPSCGPPPNAWNELRCSSCQPQAGAPIELATGNTYITEVDVSVPGLGGGLHLTRTWNSRVSAIQQSFPSMFGANWRSDYEERLVFNSGDGFMKHAEASGSVSSYATASMGTHNVYMAAAPANDTTTTITDGSQAWTLVSKDGGKRLFDPTSGVLVALVDRNGNTTQLTYDSSNRLITVTDPASRHLYFNYTGTSTLVSTVTSDVGITLSYAYDGLGRLTQVTKPDNTTISFAYDSGSRITTVTDSNGKILESHTYDAQGRGLTSSRAGGVEAVTITYP